MAVTSQKDLTQGAPWRLILSFTLPVLLGQLFQQLYSVVDTAIVGRTLGSTALAAVGSTGSLTFMVIGLCNGISEGMAIPVAQALGARDESRVRRLTGNIVHLYIIVSAVVCIVSALLCHQLLTWMNTPEDIINQAHIYLLIIFLGLPATMLYNTCSAMMRAVGDSRTPTIFLITATVINITLDLALILWCNLGVAGAALATVISQALAAVGCLLVIRKKFPILRLSRDDLRLRPQVMATLLGMGLPMGLQFSITSIGSLISQAAVNGLGTRTVAAMSASSRLWSVYSTTFCALATTIGVYAGQNVGARRLDRVHAGLRASLIMAAICSAASLAITVLFGRQLLGLFIDPGETGVLAQGYQAIVAIVAFMMLCSAVTIIRTAIQGMGFARVAMLAGVMEMIGRAMVAVLFVPVWGFPAATLISPAAWVLALPVLVLCYYSRMHRLRIQFQQSERSVSHAA